MTRTIWKFPLTGVAEQTIQMPQGAEILTVQTQGADICAWAMVDPLAKKTPRTLVICGTGLVAPTGALKYIATVQMMSGMFVWHIFEKL